MGFKIILFLMVVVIAFAMSFDIAAESEEIHEALTQNIMSQISRERVPCDISSTPQLSCKNCTNVLVCLPVLGGVVVPCESQLRPYCANGVCSPIPSEECEARESY